MYVRVCVCVSVDVTVSVWMCAFVCADVCVHVWDETKIHGTRSTKSLIDKVDNTVQFFVHLVQ